MNVTVAIIINVRVLSFFGVHGSCEQAPSVRQSILRLYQYNAHPITKITPDVIISGNS